MLKKLLAATAVFAATAFASAQPVMSVSDIGPNGAGLTTGNNVGLDIGVGLGGANWLTGGLAGTASVGSFRYASDPNGAVALIGTHDYDASDEVTMASRPRSQTAAARFKTGGNGEPSLAGGYVGPLTSTPGAVDVSTFQDPLANPETNDGYIFRVVVDLSGTGVDAADVYAIAGTTPTGAGHTLIATGRAGAGIQGFPDALDPGNSTAWSLFAVPEPASLALLVLGGLAAFRRR